MPDHSPLAIVPDDDHDLLLVSHSGVDLTGVEEERAVSGYDPNRTVRSCRLHTDRKRKPTSQMSQRAALTHDVAARESGFEQGCDMGVYVAAVNHEVGILVHEFTYLFAQPPRVNRRARARSALF